MSAGYILFSLLPCLQLVPTQLSPADSPFGATRCLLLRRTDTLTDKAERTSAIHTPLNHPHPSHPEAICSSSSSLLRRRPEKVRRGQRSRNISSHTWRKRKNMTGSTSSYSRSPYLTSRVTAHTNPDLPRTSRRAGYSSGRRRSDI